MDLPNITAVMVRKVRDRLKKFEDYEKAKELREKAQNSLEAFVLEVG
jgi:hypothetical protein